MVFTPSGIFTKPPSILFTNAVAFTLAKFIDLRATSSAVTIKELKVLKLVTAPAGSLVNCIPFLSAEECTLFENVVWISFKVMFPVVLSPVQNAHLDQSPPPPAPEVPLVARLLATVTLSIVTSIL